MLWQYIQQREQTKTAEGQLPKQHAYVALDFQHSDIVFHNGHQHAHTHRCLPVPVGV